MQSFDHSFEGFPEGRWWIAWIDHVGSDDRRQRFVHVTLSRFPEGGTSASELRTTSTETRVVKMTVAGLPFFAVGDVIHNKRLVRLGKSSAARSICDLRTGASKESFTFDAGKVARPEGWRLASERANRPADYPAGIVCPILSKKEYPFPATRNCLCLVVTDTTRTDSTRTYIIPAAELLRSLVMPFSEPLGKLFHIPFVTLLGEMVEQASHLPSHSNRFRLDLREGYARQHAPFIANLLESYNAIGHKAASRILWSLTKPDMHLQVDYKHYKSTTVPEGCSVLPCVFPFGAGLVTITAKCFALSDDRFLVAKITGGRWPPLACLEVSVPRGILDPATPPPPPSGRSKGRRRPELRGREPFDVNLRGTPGHGADPVDVVVEPLHWLGQPDITVRVRSHRSDTGRRDPITPDPRDLTSLAVGEPRADGKSAPATASHASGPVVDRFAETHAMLGRLRAAGSIVDVVPVLPNERGRSATRGPLPVWIWPESKPWHLLKSASAADRSRSLLILKLEVTQGRFVHWFCVEPSQTKSYAALLIAFVNPQSNDAVLKVVDEISKRSGTIADAEGFAVANGGRNGAKFDHVLVGASGTTQPSTSAATVPKQLNDASALDILRRLLV